MAYDGELRFNTSVDTKGFKKGLENIGSIAQTGLTAISGFAQVGIEGVAEFASISGKAITESVSLTVNAMKEVGQAAYNLSRSAINIGKTFESSMSQVAATMGITKETIDENGVKPFDVLSEAARKAGAETQYKASQAAEALNYLALAGYTATQAAEALPAVLNLAAAGGLELQYAADLATDAMSALGIVANNQNLTDFGDSMAKAAQKSNTSVGQLGEAILTVGGTAKDLAGGTTELNTALGIFANAGVKGAEGGTALRNIMLAMTPTTDKAVKAFDKLKVSAYDATTGSLRSLNETFMDLNKAMVGMSQKERTEVLNDIFNKVDLKSASAMLAACASSTEELGNAFAYAGVPTERLTEFLDEFSKGTYNAMTEEQFLATMTEQFGVTTEKADAIYSAFVTQLNGVQWEKLYNEIENCDGAMQDMAETMNDNLEGDIKIWNSALEGFGVSFYESISDTLRATVQEATKWIGQLNEAFNTYGLSGVAEEIPEIIMEIMKNAYLEIPQAVDIATEIVAVIGDGIKKNTQMLKVYGSTIITKLAEGFIDNFNVFYDVGFSVLSALTSGIAEDSNKISDATEKLVTGISATLQNNIPSLLKSGEKILISITNGIKKSLPTVDNSIRSILSTMFDMFTADTPLLLETGFEITANILDGMISNTSEIDAAVTQLTADIGAVITDNLPIILQSGFNVLMSLLRGIKDNLPLIVDTAVDIVIALADFISQNVDELIDVSMEIITMLCNELLTADNLDKLLNAALEILNGIAQGISDNLPQLIDTATQIISELVWYLNTKENQDNLISAAGEIVGIIINGAIDSADEIVDFVAALFVELGKAVYQFKWEDVGKALSEGIISGMLGVEFDWDDYLDNFAQYWTMGFSEPKQATLRDSLISGQQAINTDEIASRMEMAVSYNQAELTTAISSANEPLKNIKEDIQSGFENALNNANLDGDTNVTVNIGQEKIETIVISAIDKYNARTGGRY